MQVFFSSEDYRLYLRLLGHQARRHGLRIWAYCLMPNHVHLIAVPATEEGLARAFGEAHRRYALKVNHREGWSGHLWQERFSSFPMDEPHLMVAIRYVLLNPVRARLVGSATDWRHSSARAHILGEPDPLVSPRPVAERVSAWTDFLDEDEDPHEETTQALRRHARIGRPLGSEDFLAKLERISGRRLRPRKVGRKPRPK